jgi:hypothetical protein
MTKQEAEYSLYVWDRSDKYRAERRHVLLGVALARAREMSQHGSVTRLMITDGGDLCVLEWSCRDGLLWPNRIRYGLLWPNGNMQTENSIEGL